MGDKKRFLVSGGAGFIGSSLIDLLLEKGHDVLILDALSWGANLKNLPPDVKVVGGLNGQMVNDIPSGRCVLVVGDVSDAKLVKNLVELVDGVYHLAAQSVLPDTVVYINNGQYIRVTTISELFGEMSKKNQIIFGKDGEQVVEVRDVKVLSWRNGFGVWMPLTAVTRHPYKGEVIRLSQQAGMVCTTPNHSVYDADGNLSRPGDNPELLSIRRVNWNRRAFVQAIDLAVPGGVNGGEWWHYPHSSPIKVKKYLTGDDLDAFLEFAGAYISEGCAVENIANGGWTVNISNKDRSWLERMQKNISRFYTGSTCISSSKSGCFNLQVCGKLIYRVVEHLLGKGSSNKRMPDEIFDFCKEKQDILLRELYFGDGCVKYAATDRLGYTTTSQVLAGQLALLKALRQEDFTCAYSLATERWANVFRINDCGGYRADLNRSINREPFDGYVYDLSVEGTKKFAAGPGMAVVHNTHVDRSYGDVLPFVNSNVVGSYAMLEAVRASKYRIRCVFVSTDEVYGDVENGFSTETAPLAPRNIYSTLKAGGDLLAQAYAEIFNLDVVIARPANNYGPRQFEEKLIPKILTYFSRRDVPGRKIPIFGDGNQVRDWLFVRDTADGLVALYERGKSGNAYNLGAHQFRTVLEVVQAISDLIGRDWREHIEHLPDRIRGDRRYALDLSKTQRDINWKASTSFEKGLEETVRWYLR